MKVSTVELMKNQLGYFLTKFQLSGIFRLSSKNSAKKQAKDKKKSKTYGYKIEAEKIIKKVSVC